MKQTKYKEYRMFIVCVCIIIMIIPLLIMSILNKSMLRMILASFLLVWALMVLIIRFNIVLDQDYLVSYKWQVAAMLPYMIEYKDIQNISKISKHVVVIEHNDTSKIYVLNSDTFMNDINNRLKEYKEND